MEVGVMRCQGLYQLAFNARVLAGCCQGDSRCACDQATYDALAAGFRVSLPSARECIKQLIDRLEGVIKLIDKLVKSEGDTGDVWGLIEAEMVVAEVVDTLRRFLEQLND